MKNQFIFIAAVALLISRTTHAGILAGPITNTANRHIYYLLTQNTWPASRAEAITLGGDLVVIRNANENSFVFTNFAGFSGVPRGLWIGLSDRRRESCWEWESGDPATFLNWATGNSLATSEPNGGTIQNFAFIRPYFLNAAGSYLPSRWNDSGMSNNTSGFPISTGNVTNFPLHGVVEIVPTSTVSNLTVRTAVEIAWPSQSNSIYQVQWASELDTNTWQNLGVLLKGDGSTTTILDSTEGVARRFYRVLRQD